MKSSYEAASVWKVTGPQESGSDYGVIGREYPELTLPFNAVRCEVCVINGKNYGKKFTLRQIHQRAIGKIHGSVRIARHETVDNLQSRICECTEHQCSRADEAPCGRPRRARIDNQVE